MKRNTQTQNNNKKKKKLIFTSSIMAYSFSIIPNVTLMKVELWELLRLEFKEKWN